MRAIVGFGRSGTTWLGEVVERLTDGLVLNEPLHPSRGLTVDAMAGRDNDLLLELLTGNEHDPWLIRSMAGERGLATVDMRALKGLARQREIVGFKEIHACFVLPWITTVSEHCVYVVRDPVDIVASILRRPSFFSWGTPWSFHVIANEIICRGDRSHELARFWPETLFARTPAQQAAVLWAAANYIGLRDAAALGVPVFRYDDLLEEDHLAACMNALGVDFDAERARAGDASVTTTNPTAPHRMSLEDERDVIRICEGIYPSETRPLATVRP